MKLHKIGLALMLSLPVALPAVGWVTPVHAQQTKAKEGWYGKLVDIEFVKQNVDIPPRKGVMIIDSRPTARQYDPGHIPGAISMFVQTIPARLSELPQDRPIVLQCWHGHTSLDASGFLVQNGWPAANIASLTGGIAGWVQVHGPGSLVRD